MLLSLVLVSCAAKVDFTDPTPLPPTDDAATVIVPSDAAVDSGAQILVYANSESSLYSLDPETFELLKVGDFDCDLGVTEIAVAKDGRMFGVGHAANIQDWSLVRIDKANAHCDRVAKIAEIPTSLSFVPIGTVDATEALVAYLGYNMPGDGYVRYDEATGNATHIGALSNGLVGWKYGDMVSIEGGDSYVTATSTQLIGPELVVLVDPKTGAYQNTALTLANVVGGLAFWRGTLFGFDAQGRVWAFDPKTQGQKIVATAKVSFIGAAVATNAPTMPR
jgi:hypothetical protein